MDNLSWCLAAFPLGAYCLALARINLSRGSTCVSGSRESAALALALAGLMTVGPLKLFLPEDAATRFGSQVWLLLLSLYLLAATLWILVQRPRLVIYNIRLDALRPIVVNAAASLDPDARFAGDTLSLPRLPLVLRLQSFATMRNCTLELVSCGESIDAWQTLQKRVVRDVKTLQQSVNPRGWGLLTAGIALVALGVFRALDDPLALAQGMRELLRL